MWQWWLTVRLLTYLLCSAFVVLLSKTRRDKITTHKMINSRSIEPSKVQLNRPSDNYRCIVGQHRLTHDPCDMSSYVDPFGPICEGIYHHVYKAGGNRFINGVVLGVFPYYVVQRQMTLIYLQVSGKMAAAATPGECIIQQYDVDDFIVSVTWLWFVLSDIYYRVLFLPRDAL